MYILLFIFWVILNQKINLEILLFGVGLTTLVSMLMNVLFGYTIQKEFKYIKKIPLFIKYLGILLIEIIKASLTMIKIVLNKKIKVEPTVVRFRSGLKTKMGNFILANSITLTPGTITIENDGDKFLVHCLDRSMLDISKDSTFISSIRKMEEK